jgi:hypothetical protein
LETRPKEKLTNLYEDISPVEDKQFEFCTKPIETSNDLNQFDQTDEFCSNNLTQNYLFQSTQNNVVPSTEILSSKYLYQNNQDNSPITNNVSTSLNLTTLIPINTDYSTTAPNLTTLIPISSTTTNNMTMDNISSSSNTSYNGLSFNDEINSNNIVILDKYEDSLIDDYLDEKNLPKDIFKRFIVTHSNRYFENPESFYEKVFCYNKDL